MGRLSAVLLVFVLCSASVHGVPLDTLYDAEVPVATGEDADRNRGFRDALAEVLVRITGKTDTARRPEANEILGRAGDYVEQFRYMDSGVEEPAYLIWVRFDGPALEEAVSQAGMPVWRSERPAVLTWLAVTGRVGDRRLLGESDVGDATDTLKRASTRRGVPVVLPLLDLEDMKHVGVADVAGGFDDNVRQASARYRPDAVWIGHARGSRDGYWKIDWRLYLGAATLDWSSEGTSLAQSVERGVDGMADRLGGRLAVLDRSQSPDRVILEIEGVGSMRDYARLQRYLSGVGRVSVFRPWRIEPGRAAWLLQLRGTPGDLVGEIALGTTLAEVPPDASGSLTASIPVFVRYGESTPSDRSAGTDQDMAPVDVVGESGGPAEGPAEGGGGQDPGWTPIPGEAGAPARVEVAAGAIPASDVAYEELRVLRYRLAR